MALEVNADRVIVETDYLENVREARAKGVPRVVLAAELAAALVAQDLVQVAASAGAVGH